MQGMERIARRQFIEQLFVWILDVVPLHTLR